MELLPVLGAVLGDASVLASGDLLLQNTGGFEQEQYTNRATPGSSFVATLVVGALLIGLANDYVTEIAEYIENKPVASFAWGVGAMIGFVVVFVLLAITVVGLIVAIPLAFVFVFVAIAGNVLAFIAVTEQFVDERWVALLVAAVVTAVLNAIPGVGSLVSFVIGSIGLGAVVRHWYT
ncbi:hypothetical protein L593_08015 [Salinarchaeum sp. Harcht-Bsk1]|uniref:hypothetical protein n=1 Tax=Salinarchaeum sp. Harcht-Bsk1 TaxID=1333523 RepID=UPI0003423C69|nr:hypothetical protein [Salinarchaeum sp. Harcht-Bsk1]AGN01548.1 hypothetical protein L593_08015 [Salinarchaeum sp. Harcht-Bsk1]